MNRERVGFWLGVVLFIALLFLPTPEGLSRPAQNAAAVTVLMACWWVTEAIPICATAFVPLALFPMLGVLDAKATAANFGHYFVVMLLCAMIIAKAIERNQLHKRIALGIMKRIGVSRRRILLSTMLATAFLSMWLSNFAVTVMMLPIGMALARREEKAAGGAVNAFSTALMLSIAYSASIGGVGTLIGTPPNLVFAGVLKNMYPNAPEISFVKWLGFGVPLVALFLPICWAYLVAFFKVKGSLPGSRETIVGELDALGAMRAAEKRTALIGIATVLGWVFRKDLEIGSFHLPGWASLTGLDAYVNDATVAAIGMLALFATPTGEAAKEAGKAKPRLMDWQTAAEAPWGIIMIIAGGYCLASGFSATGLTDYIGQLLSFISVLPAFLVVLLVVAALSFLTEINSNTATSNIFLPILGTMAIAASANPLLLMIPGTIACSLAFMLPSGTGPNGIVFASGHIRMPTMVSCGVWLNFIGILIVTLAMYLLAIPLFDVAGETPDWAK